MSNTLQSKADHFFQLAGQNVRARPWLVVILMHEYFRNLYPADPHIPFSNNPGSDASRIATTLDTCTALLEQSTSLGSYFDRSTDGVQHALSAMGSGDPTRPEEGTTQQVYGKLWDQFDAKTYTEEAYEILLERFKGNDFDLTSLKNQTVLDMGCGSGRYALALAMTGAKTVHAIDLGEQSIRNAKEMAKRAKLKNTEFRVGSVLDLPYDDNAFDFVFSNGVLHHTTDMEKGIRELHRVLKPNGSAFLYLYADGGLFWHSRREMRPIMQQIDQDYTMAVLNMIAMPKNRFFFVDNWYVPIERHTTKPFLENYLRQVGFASLRKIQSGRPTDLDHPHVLQHPDADLLWGDGEHRYLLKK